MKNYLILIVLLMCQVQVVLAQSVKGTIKDSNNKALPNVTIRMLNADSVFIYGTSTDSLGCYFIPLKQKGEYLLHISFVGYKSQIYPINVVKDESFQAIILSPNNILLDELVVNASSFIRQDDKILIYPDKQVTKHSSNGYDLLYRLMIPGIDVDRREGNVTTFHGNVTLYIDGRKVDVREIRGLRPKDIAKVEYYDVPTGKYVNDEASINFVTKKYKTGGYVSLNGEQSIGYTKGKYEAVAKLAHENTSYTLFTGYSMKNHEGEFENMQENFFFSDHETKRSTRTLENRMKNNSQYAQLNISNIDEKRNLIGKFSVVRNNQPDNSYCSLLDYNNGQRQQKSLRYTDELGWKYETELYGNFELANKQFLEMNFKGNYTKNTYSSSYQEEKFSFLNDNKEDLYDLYTRITYGVQFEHKNSLTLQAFHLHTISSVNYAGEVSSWQHFWEGESLLFVEYNQQLGSKLSLKLAPGFSYLQYRLHGQSKEGTFSPRLRSRLVYRPTKTQQIMLNFPIGNGELHINQLNEVEQHIDSLQIRRGNPNQRIAFQNTLMISYSGQFGRFNMGADVWYNVINHAPTEDLFIEKDKLIRSYHTDGKHRMFLTQLSAAWKMTKSLRVKFSGTWKSVEYRDTPEKMHCFAGNAQIDYYWKDFSFSAFAKSRDKELNLNLMYLTTPSNYGAFLTWSHKNWRMEGGVSNPFSRHRKSEAKMDRDVYIYQNVMTGKPYHSNGYVKVAYTFDFGKKTSRDQNEVNTDINSAIMKAD